MTGSTQDGRPLMTGESGTAPETAEEPVTAELDHDPTIDDEGERFLDDAELRGALEAVLLVVDSPISTEELATVVDQDRIRVRTAVEAMSAELTAAGSGIDLRYAGDGWRFYTRAEFAPYVENLLLDGARSKLTRAALETLAVIAYRQPVTRARVSAIRGVNVDGVVRTLLARGLINEAGADEQTHATMYETTELFLERLGLASLAELPDLAPLLPDVDVIDDLGEELLDDPRFARLSAQAAESDADTSADVLRDADEGTDN